MNQKIYQLSFSFFIIFILLISQRFEATCQIGQDEKIMMLQTNLVVDPADSLLARIDRAQAKGANTVLFSDSKLNIYGANGTAGSQWKDEMTNLVNGIRDRNLKLILATITTGFNGGVLSSNPHLTTGYPIIDQELKAVDGALEPVTSSEISNGGFESFTGNEPDGWSFQDQPGNYTFIDNVIKRSGDASFRIDPSNGDQARIFRSFPVKPHHQYTIVVWVKMENLTANKVFPLIRDNNNLDRRLTNLYMSTPKSNGGRSYIKNVQNFNLDWTEMRIAFNSLDATEVNLGLTVYGGQNGSVWWDDLSIEDTPFLNWINRDDLPEKAINGSTVLEIGDDIQRPVDSLLGQSGFTGSFDTHHQSPIVKILNNANIDEGDIIKMSGYHALPTASSAQVSGAWNNPEWINTVKTVHERLFNDFQPDGFLLNYSEIRTGGWEPNDTIHGTSGNALAQSIQKVFADMDIVAPGVEKYFWNDMVDPHHNSKPNYYQVNNTLDQSWVTLDPEEVKIITWREGQKITDFGHLSLAHFSDLGFEQIIGGFYDADVTSNFNRWTDAADGIENIKGSVYATWVKDYSKIEEFGDLWWSEQSIDSLISVDGPNQVIPGEDYEIAVNYTASEDRDIIVVLQLNQAPWTNYGSTRITIPAGTNNTTLSITVNEEMPIAEDLYKWTAILTSINGGWVDRFDAIIEADVDAIENNLSEPFLLRNLASRKYMRPIDDTENARIVIAPNDGSEWFKWQTKESDNGFFYLVNVQTGKYFKPITTNDGSNMEQKSVTENGTETQWSFIPAGNGRVFINNRNANKYIRPRNRITNTNVQIRPNTWTGVWTKWNLEFLENNITRTSPMKPIGKKKLTLKVYPNPASEFLFFEIDQLDHKHAELQLINQQGQFVKRIRLNDDTALSYFRVNELGKGIYFLKLIKEGEVEIRKVLIQ